MSVESVSVKRVIAVVLIGAAQWLSGCSNAKQGALSGAGIGALSGLAIGSLSGNAGKGAAIGAILGGVGGGVIGDQNKRSQDQAATREAGTRAMPATVVAADADRAMIGRLAGRWSLTGWSEVVASDRRDLRGSAEGVVEQDYFLRLDASIVVGPGDTRTGVLLFASEPGRGVTLSSRFSDSPSTSRFLGSGSADSRTITLEEVDSIIPGVRRRMVIRFQSPSEWVVDVTNLAGPDGARIGSFRFVRPE